MIIEKKDILAEHQKYFQYLYQSTNLKPYCDYPPHQLFIEPTNKCNLECEMCIQHKMTREKGYMELDLMKKIIDDVVEFDPFFDFCRQGEPLMHKQISEMIEYAVQSGLTKTRLITNGTLLRGDVVDKIIKSGLHKINISFNGYNKESYDRIQKGANFEVSLKNVVNFLKRKFELNSVFPKVEISIVKYNDLEENIKGFYELFSDLPVDRIRESTSINFLGSNEDKQMDENIKKDYSEWPSCKVPFRFFNVNWNGDVTPCVVDYNSIYSVGNVKDNSVLEVWNSDKMQQFRQNHIDKDFDTIKKNSNGTFCNYCSSLWVNPNSNGPQYPESFEDGVNDFFQKKDNKHMAGKYKNEVFRTEEEISKLGKEFLKSDSQQILDKLIESAI